MNINSSVTKSKHFETIMQKYDKFGKDISMRSFWSKYVKEIDPSITYKVWNSFMNKFKEQVVHRVDNIIEKYVDKTANENTMEKSSMKKIMQIADATLDDIINNPGLLASIPAKDRMSWLFSAMKAKDSRMVTVAKVKAEERKTNLYEDMLKGAQYGEIQEGELIDSEDDDEVVESLEAPKPNISIPVANKKSVEFNPNEL